MGHSMKRLCTICARGGSKGLPNKNIRQMVGKPLIAHSILQAKSSGLFEAIAVSSDSMKILDISKKFGARTAKPSKNLRNQRLLGSQKVFRNREGCGFQGGGF